MKLLIDYRIIWCNVLVLSLCDKLIKKNILYNVNIFSFILKKRIEKEKFLTEYNQTKPYVEQLIEGAGRE